MAGTTVLLADLINAGGSDVPAWLSIRQMNEGGGAAALTTFLREHAGAVAQVVKLDLSGNDLGAGLAELDLSPLTSLSTLKLMNNQLGDVDAIERVVGQVSAHLVRLDLSQNMLSDSQLLWLRKQLGSGVEVVSAGVTVSSRSRIMSRFSGSWQLVDLATDIALVASLASGLGSGFSWPNLVAVYLLVLAIVIGLIPFLRTRDKLREFWNGDAESILAYKAFSLAEGSVELCVFFATAQQTLGPIDIAFLVGTAVLLLLDLNYVVGRLRVSIDAASRSAAVFLLVTAVTVTALAVTVYVTDAAPLLRLLLLGVAALLAAAVYSVLALAEEPKFALAFAGIQPHTWSGDYFATRWLRMLVLLVSLPLVIPMLLLSAYRLSC